MVNNSELRLGVRNLKIDNKKIGLISLCVYVTYFILRCVYDLTHIKIISSITVMISLGAGMVLFPISLRLFFHDKNKKECLQLLVISTILIIINVIDYLV